MNARYTLLLIICMIASAAVTFKFGPMLLSDAEQDVSPQDAPLSRAQGDAILKELAAIHATLENIEKKDRAAQRPKVPPTASVSVENRPVLGNSDAKVTVVEFTDYQCPYCRRFMTTTYPRLKQEYIETGKVRWVVRDMPLGFHKQARLAATGAHCAAEQGKFWEFRELLYQNQAELLPQHLEKYAAQAGIDVTGFRRCVDSDRYQAQFDKDAQAAAKERITGTPTFVIGTPDANNIVTGKRIVGAQAYTVFSREIERLLHTGKGN
jgi:protein-disulfide isomerase